MVCGFLWLSILIKNANRTGTFLNMTLDEVSAAQKRGADRIILVKDHKTKAAYGSADVIVDCDLYKHIQNYIKKYRCASATDAVFTNWGGSRVRHGDVSKSFR